MNLDRFFRGKVVLITGSSRGIGREAARQALDAGAFVVVHGRDRVATEATRVSLGAPDRTATVAGDLANRDTARAVVAEALLPWGRLDVLINNAGLSMRGAFAELSVETVETMVGANLLTAVWTTQAALPALRATQGRVVFVSSLAGVRGFPGVSLYSASKMALAAVQQSLQAEEQASGLRASLVSLAFTENDPGKTVLGADGRPFQHERRWSTTQQASARALLLCAARGRDQVVTMTGRWLVAMNRLAPRWTGRLLGAGRSLHAVNKLE
jgi:NAD(P)-dependent dehydrogenase (short-subunit alcohol dehydrogenase family)